jgi:hypothetical protein
MKIPHHLPLSSIRCFPLHPLLSLSIETYLLKAPSHNFSLHFHVYSSEASQPCAWLFSTVAPLDQKY